jgi:hypothetical protein
MHYKMWKCRWTKECPYIYIYNINFVTSSKYVSMQVKYISNL